MLTCEVIGVLLAVMTLESHRDIIAGTHWEGAGDIRYQRGNREEGDYPGGQVGVESLGKRRRGFSSEKIVDESG